MSKTKPIPVETIPDVDVADLTPREVGQRFRRLLSDDHELRVYGQAKADPNVLLKRYQPKYMIELFGTHFFLCDLRHSHDLKLMPAYILPATDPRRKKPALHARVLYKDSSLVWRAASHYINTPDDQWIGKGAVKYMDKRGERGWFSAEETTNMPFELQAALDEVSRRSPKAKGDRNILFLMLRNAPEYRIRPYHDFEGPREKAMKVAANRINRNRSIAWFEDEDDPRSLVIAPGFEPDFRAIIDQSTSSSYMYGGEINRYRIASVNRKIQYMFVEGPDHVWLIHPQALTTELSTFGLRTVDVIADDDMSIPGYEFADNNGEGEIDDQIPPGYAGEVCPHDPDRADASPWNEKMPIIKAFRRSRLTGISP